MPDTITFYRIHESYGCFSNFAPYPVEIDGLPLLLDKPAELVYRAMH
jgi:predicted NAD-dependent protein-ADP-ribosyltransferase YbiA (DUF1768 family)